MRFLKTKLLIIAFFALLCYFFSNDFGLIDIEKTAIVTAIGIDKNEKTGYDVTLQIAVPEANGVTSENAKAVIKGNGKTVAEAIQKIGEESGWYPKLSFCNLVLIGSNMFDSDIMVSIDYFIRTIKIQDSALLAGVENRAEDFMEKATPLDNISSFSLQKILLKKPGMTQNTLTTDIKEFALGYYSRTGSSFMPYIKIIPVKNSEQNSQSNKNKEQKNEAPQNGEKVVFDASKTLLLKNGKVLDALTKEETLSALFSMRKIKDSTISVEKVLLNGRETDFLLTVIKNDYSVKTTIKDGKIVLSIKEKVFVKVSDETDKTTETGYLPLSIVPKEVCLKLENDLIKSLSKAIEKSIKTKCDLFRSDLDLYRFNNKEYKKLNGDFFNNLSCEIAVDVYGQKRL